MFDVGDRGSRGLVTNIQMTRNMTYIAASILKSAPKNDNHGGLGDIEFDEEEKDEDIRRSSSSRNNDATENEKRFTKVQLYKIDHEAESKLRHE